MRSNLLEALFGPLTVTVVLQLALLTALSKADSVVNA